MRLQLHLGSVTCLVLIQLAILQDVALAQKSSADTDPVRAELIAMGKAGEAISLARDKVMQILQSENSCSAWFKKADPNAAATFASLRFILDPKGPRYILGWRANGGETLFKHPYSGSTIAGRGPKSAVTLNANGPFFVRSGPVFWQPMAGIVPRPLGWGTFEVGAYPGNTAPAQIVTLLHEFGHVVGRIPNDSDELSGQSGRNTEQVIRYCHAQIKAASRHSGHGRD